MVADGFARLARVIEADVVFHHLMEVPIEIRN